MLSYPIQPCHWNLARLKRNFSMVKHWSSERQPTPSKCKHPQAHNGRFVKTLMKRLDTHCHTSEAKEEELRYLKRQFSLNGYPRSFDQKTLRKRDYKFSALVVKRLYNAWDPPVLYQTLCLKKIAVNALSHRKVLDKYIWAAFWSTLHFNGRAELVNLTCPPPMHYNISITAI